MASDREQTAFEAWVQMVNPLHDELRELARDAFAAGFVAALKPHPAMKDAVPVVLFFRTLADADEFVAVVKELKPALVGHSIG